MSFWYEFFVWFCMFLVWVFCLIKPQVKFLVIAYKYQVQAERCITQRSLQNVLIFRLLLKITVERLRECVSSYFLSPYGAHISNFNYNHSLFCCHYIWLVPTCAAAKLAYPFFEGAQMLYLNFTLKYSNNMHVGFVF